MCHSVKAQLTSKNWKPPHCRKRMIPRSVQNVQLVNVSPDAVEFPMKVLDGGCVLVVNFLVQKPRDDGCLPNLSGAQNHHPVAILGRNVELTLRWGHFLNHTCSSCTPRSMVLEKEMEFEVFQWCAAFILAVSSEAVVGQAGDLWGKLAAPPKCVMRHAPVWGAGTRPDIIMSL